MVDFAPNASGSVAGLSSGVRKVTATHDTRKISGRMTTVTFSFPEERGPALRSAIDEISGIVGTRIAGAHRWMRECALTDAAIGLGALRAAVNQHVLAGDEQYV